MYDIQTTYKDVVYSIKLKMEFLILNQLIALVKGSLRGQHSFQHPVSQSRHLPAPADTAGDSIIRSIVRSPLASEVGHTAGAYMRMNESNREKGVELQDLKGSSVLKSTITEIHVGRAKEITDDAECSGS